MDPSYWEATMRHQIPKPKKGNTTNSVERQFRKNPFAKALATPIRQCTATKTRLPSFFLQDFNLVSHPKSGHPWWVPRSLAWEEPGESQQADMAGDQQANIEVVQVELGAPEETPGAERPTATQANHGKPYGPSAYTLAKKDLISAFGVNASGYTSHPKRLFGGSSSHYARLAGKAVWREDMASVILDRMQREIVEDFIYLSRLCVEDSRHYMARCHGWDDVQYKHQGAILWFGEASEHDATKPETGPGPFATYNVSKDGITTSVAVHNIPMLLGTKNTAEVRERSPMLADGSLFMLAGRRTAKLQGKMWRLQGYMSSHDESPGQGGWQEVILEKQTADND
ncbi:hypothetical protein EKO27_g1813 [Xylaria grammica]|uniref:Uncharacterized protein n=1 Tax=Xylaria grammica TaxID=363999 RepID=A0A439DFY4_9PEZI|nr:hypothetical protein EKO27_g1813 [Xylaria grammica]